MTWSGCWGHLKRPDPKCTRFCPSWDLNTWPPDQESGAQTKELASRLRVWLSAGFSTLLWDVSPATETPFWKHVTFAHGFFCGKYCMKIILPSCRLDFGWGVCAGKPWFHPSQGQLKMLLNVVFALLSWKCEILSFPHYKEVGECLLWNRFL